MQKITPKNNQHTRKRSASNRSVSPNIFHPLNKNKQNIHLLKNAQIQSLDNPANKSIKICLQLASHHKKESEDLKLKNQLLDYRLNQQLTSMQALKKQLSQIHSQTQNAQKKHKKQFQQLKTQNQRLNKDVQELKSENIKLKSQIKSSESIMTEIESRSETQIGPLVLDKQSRRQKYASHYEHINFMPSVACLFCKQLQNQVQIERQNHCRQLLKFQQQLFFLQKKQQVIDKKEFQMKEQNQCISYLFNQLNKFETNAQIILQTMEDMEYKIEELTKNNKSFRRVTDKYMSYSCSNSII